MSFNDGFINTFAQLRAPNLVVGSEYSYIKVLDTPYVIGQNFGYVVGGQNTPAPSPAFNIIEKYPFAVAGANSADTGDLTRGRLELQGHSSSSNGYASGGGFTVGANENTIDKFPFASNSNATDVGDLQDFRFTRVAPHVSYTHGYVSGGVTTPGASPTGTIQKFPFSTDSNSTESGVLSVARSQTTGISSSTHGYTAGGIRPGGVQSNIIDRFPFANDVNSTDVGDLNSSMYSSGGVSSISHGYIISGFNEFGSTTNINRFSFASSTTNATNIGDANGGFTPRLATAATISHGHYGSGSPPSSPSVKNSIDRFAFSSDTTHQSVGFLTVNSTNRAGLSD